MRRALTLAQRGWGQVAPNPMVGAVVVQQDRVVGEGWHARFGGPHAEVAALEAAGDAAHGATLYVTLEPCNHVGKTPPCVKAILAAGIARVVYAVSDPNPLAAGGGAALAEQGVSVQSGLLAGPAGELLASFRHAAATAGLAEPSDGAATDPGYRPWITLKLALSLDGALADHTRRPGWITGRRARVLVHTLRAGADAVAVGIGTALADDPALTVRHGRVPRVPPIRVVFDRHARLPADSQLVRTLDQAPVVVVAGPAASGDAAERERRAALEARGVTVLSASSLDDGLAQLRRSGVQHLFVEGGAGLASALVGANRVDRLIIFRGSVILGGEALPAFAALPRRTVGEGLRWRVVSRRALGDDSMTTYAVLES